MKLSKRYISLISFLFIALVGVQGQMLNCGTDDLNNEILLNNSDLAILDQEANLNYRKKINSKTNSQRNTEIVLPVVFHIIHQGGSDNISDSKILKGLQNLNDAFANRGYYNPQTGVDAKIQFCLAQQDTSNQAFDGIIRYQSPLADMSTHFDYDAITNLAYLDPTKYINIRIATNVCLGQDCDRRGYAVNAYVGDLAYRNGIIVQYDAFGLEPFDDIVIIHEMGHFLGLRHTFYGGCKNDDCLIDGDRICDTPPDNSNAQLWCSFEENSCLTDPDDITDNNPFRPATLGGIGDQSDANHNYMDYAGYICYDQFSQGQADRMHWFVEYKFPGLLSSKTCYPPCQIFPIASFLSASDTTIDIGSGISFINNSTASLTYIWYYDGDSISTNIDLSYTFLELGFHTITLAANSDNPGCETSFYQTTIEVVCPVVADFNYIIDPNFIIFTDASIASNNIDWTISDGDDNLLLTSSEAIDSFDFTGYDFIQLCIEASNPYCASSFCEFITLVNDGSEICNDGIDNDDDGFVDVFDTDCPCGDLAFQAQCEPECQVVPDSFPDFAMKLKWQSEVIGSAVAGNICVANQNEETQIFTKTNDSKSLIDVQNFISIIDGNSGVTNLKFAITDSLHFNESSTWIAIGNIMHDGRIFTYTRQFDQNIYCFDDTGDEVWSTFLDIDRGVPGIADLNGDGIPEIYVSNTILNAITGAVLFQEIEAKGCNAYSDFPGIDNNTCSFAYTVAADLTSSPGLELAAGSKVYEYSINNLSGSIGNTVNVIQAEATVTDGTTAIADIDMDGLLDVIVVRNINFTDGGGIWVWNPRTTNIIASSISDIDGSIPFVGDLDGDCIPEIGITFKEKLNVYDYDNTAQLQLKYSLPTTDESGHTGLTMFDFNQDGIQEIIYRDESELRIIDGPTGITLTSTPINSITGGEFPIVADVDNDGEAEILVNGYIEDDEEYRLYCFESDGTPWAPARSVWNQAAYYVTNVNDDLTIPRYPQNQAAFFDTDSCGQETCPQPYNSFMSQATYRTQQGCVVWPGSDLDLQISASYTCLGDSTEICLYVISNDTFTISQGVPVTCYAPPWEGMDTTLDQIIITEDTICITYLLPAGVDSIMIVVNDDGGLFPPSFPTTDIQECDYENNFFVLHIDNNLLSLDLGEDIIRCGSDPISLNAGGGFTSYLWSDFTTDSLYTTGDDGLHFVSAYDECGRLYTDTIQILTDSSQAIDLIADNTTYCYLDTVRLSMVGNPDSIIWYPESLLSCTQCPNPFMIADTSILITGVAYFGECLATDTLTISILQPVFDSISLMICENDTLEYLDLEITEAGIYDYISSDCDSVIQITVAQIPAKTGYFTDTLCFGDSVLIEGVYYSIPGTFDIILAASNSCDSILTVDLLVRDSLFGEELVDICDGDSILIDNLFYFQDTSFIISSINALGCDSTTMIDISLVEELFDTTEIHICEGDSVFILDEWQFESNIFSESYSTPSGCDSTLITELYVDTLSIKSLSESICFGDTFHFDDQYSFTLDSTYFIGYTNVAGCDSIIEIDLQVNMLELEEIPVSICEGDSVVIENIWYDSDTTISISYSNSLGCDSTVTYLISVSDYIYQDSIINICLGDSLLINGKYYLSDTIVMDTVESESCPIVTNYIIDNFPSESSSEELFICQGDTIIIGNQMYFNEDTILTTLVSSYGCDSLHSIILRYFDQPNEPVISVDCEAGIYSVEVMANPLWQAQWDNGEIGLNATYSIDFTSGSVVLTHPDNCIIEYDFDFPTTIDLSSILLPDDTLISVGSIIDYDFSGLFDQGYRITWSADLLDIECDTCYQQSFTVLENTAFELLFTDQNECQWLHEFTVQTFEKSDFDTPNIFSPNGDNINDYWTIDFNELIINKTSVFDRWGNNIGNWQNVEKLEWDGMLNGRFVEQGVYVYIINYTGSDGKVNNIAGTVTVIR